MKLKSLAAAAVLAFAGSGAYAVVSPTFDAAGSASFESGTLAVGGFTQVINFLGLGSGTYDITGSLSGNKATFSSVFLNGAAWDLSGGTTGKWKFGEIEYNGVGPFTLTLNGNAQKNGFFNGSLQAALVPEPETYALLLAGLGVVGFVARRRRPQ